MNRESTFRFTPQLVLGLIIILCGVLFTLDNIGVLDAGDYLRYWPVLLIVYGLSRMAQPRRAHGPFVGLIFTVIGAALLLDKLNILGFRIWDYWPLILVLIGGTLIWRASSRQRRVQGYEATDSSKVNAFAFFSGIERTNNSQNFRGGELTAIMGGCELDLRQASIKNGNAVIDIFAFWGGICIRVPEDWSVTIEGTPLMGGIEDKRHPVKGETEKHVVIKGYAIMGGLEISN
jgi:predicted membrane protein